MAAARGHTVEYRLASEKKIELEQFGEYLFDNVVVFAPAATKLGSLDAPALLTFLDDGGNLLVAGDSEISEPIRALAAECGVEFHESGSAVMDHVSFDAADVTGDHTRILASTYTAASPIVGSLATNPVPVVFKGLGQTVAKDNILAIPALVASATAFSAQPGERLTELPATVGAETVLVTAVQARNNARATFSGSLFLFSDEAFAAAARSPATGAAQPTANRALATALSAWTFQERGVLRASHIRHQRADGSQPEFSLSRKYRQDLPKSVFPEPEIAPENLVYRIKDDLEYYVDLEEFNGTAWVPFAASDVQLEFVMLDAYVRTTMTHNGDGVFKAAFKAPDVYGVYKFRVLYRRPGLSVVHHETQVSVRPYRHNEYDRFLVAAYPYYTAAFAMMAGFFVFAYFFVNTKSNTKKE